MYKNFTKLYITIVVQKTYFIILYLLAILSAQHCWKLKVKDKSISFHKALFDYI